MGLEDKKAVIEAYRKHGTKRAAAQALGVPESTFRSWLQAAEESQEEAFNRQIRGLEAKNSRLSEELKAEKKRRDLAEKDLHDVLKREEELGGIKSNTLEIPRFRKTGSKSPATALILASDWHVEEVVDSDQVSGLNEYNLEVAERRASRLFQKAVYLIELSRNICEVRDACLWLGGDFITGYIHEELVEGNALGPAEAVAFSSRLINGGIDYILNNANIDRLTVVCNRGNHGRSTNKTRHSTDYKSSWEWVLYQHLAACRKEDKNVEWYIPKGYFAYVDIQGHLCRMHHGNYIKYSGAVSGPSVGVNKAIQAWNQSRNAEYDFFGHLHQHIWHWDWVMNGALIGYNTFSLAIKSAYQPPTQTFCCIDRDRGLTMALPIFVEHGGET